MRNTILHSCPYLYYRYARGIRRIFQWVLLLNVEILHFDADPKSDFYMHVYVRFGYELHRVDMAILHQIYPYAFGGHWKFLVDAYFQAILVQRRWKKICFERIERVKEFKKLVLIDIEELAFEYPQSELEGVAKLISGCRFREVANEWKF